MTATSTPDTPRSHEPPARRRWPSTWTWRGFWNWLREIFLGHRTGPVPAAPRIPEPGFVRSEADTLTYPPLDRFRTPAKGDGFTFLVHANVVWDIAASDDSPKRVKAARERVEAAVGKRRSTIRQELMTAIRPIAREFAPFEAAELEKHLVEVIPTLLDNREDVHKPTNADSATGRVDPHRDRGIKVPSKDHYTMRVYLWVDSCPEIRQLQQQIWTSITIEAGKGRLNHQKLDERAALQKAWKEVLQTLLTSMGVRDPNQARWTELLALQLAQSGAPEDAAEPVVRMIMDRHKEATLLHSELAQYLWSANGSDGRVETMDFALASDSALARILDTLGVPDLNETRENGLPKDDTER